MSSEISMEKEPPAVEQNPEPEEKEHPASSEQQQSFVGSQSVDDGVERDTKISHGTTTTNSKDNEQKPSDGDGIKHGDDHDDDHDDDRSDDGHDADNNKEH